jgi:hypothetical protein
MGAPAPVLPMGSFVCVIVILYSSTSTHERHWIAPYKGLKTAFRLPQNWQRVGGSSVDSARQR